MRNALPTNVTSLLAAWQRGEAGALDALMTRVYPPLRRIAANQLRRQGGHSPLETKALVNEAFLRLVAQRRMSWRDRVHFFSIAARIMRRVVVDRARHQSAAKRGGGSIVCSMGAGDLDPSLRQDPDNIQALDQALEALTAVRPELARLVELRFFGGLTKMELAVALDIAPATVTRRWRLARAWLHRFLEGEAIVVG